MKNILVITGLALSLVSASSFAQVSTATKAAEVLKVKPAAPKPAERTGRTSGTQRPTTTTGRAPAPATTLKGAAAAAGTAVSVGQPAQTQAPQATARLGDNCPADVKGGQSLKFQAERSKGVSLGNFDNTSCGEKLSPEANAVAADVMAAINNTKGNNTVRVTSGVNTLARLTSVSQAKARENLKAIGCQKKCIPLSSALCSVL